MVLTQATLAFGISMIASMLALVITAYSVKQYSRIAYVSILMFTFIIPVAFHFLYMQLEPSVLVFDWPLEGGSHMAYWNPTTAIFLASMLGGFMGFVSGNYWGQGDDSCFRCLLGPFIIVLLVSIVMVFLP